MLGPAVRAISELTVPSSNLSFFICYIRLGKNGRFTHHWIKKEEPFGQFLSFRDKRSGARTKLRPLWKSRQQAKNFRWKFCSNFFAALPKQHNCSRPRQLPSQTLFIELEWYERSKTWRKKKWHREYLSILRESRRREREKDEWSKNIFKWRQRTIKSKSIHWSSHKLEQQCF